ncbi:hypothetical protein Tco_0752547 [Tanacetum coccineum]|uniref:Uncharacterized protein n=1 Tax=Tanacetum coccineum TaxID=301880 RepID=A0ABQ4Z8V1_9ASTR
MAMPNVEIPYGIDTGGSPRRQDTMGVLLLRLGLRECLNSPINHLSQKVTHLEVGRVGWNILLNWRIMYQTHPHDSPLLKVNTPGSDEGSLKLNKLLDLVTKLSHRVLDLEKVKTAQAKEIAGLKSRVTKLEQRQRSSILKNHPFIFGSSRRQSLENQGKIGADDTEVLDTEKAVNTAGEGVSTASVPETVSTAAPKTHPTTIVFDDEDVTMAMAQTLIKMKEEKTKEKGVVIKGVEDSSRPVRSITTLQPLPTIDPKYKGKGILQETESVEKKKNKFQSDAQIKRDTEVALRLQAELNEELRVKRERQEDASKVTIAEMFDEVQARMDADFELTASVTTMT